MDSKFQHAKAHLEGTQRATRDAEAQLRREHERLANCGQIFPIESIESGHKVTRYVGDIAATFALFMQPSRHGRVVNPRNRGNR